MAPAINGIDQELSVTISSKSMVSPEHAEHSSSFVPLCNLDVYTPSVEGLRFDVILLFPSHHHHHHHLQKVVGGIRKSLSKVLTHYPPLAGKLRKYNGRLHIECTGEGVLFVEAKCSNPLSILNMDYFTPSHHPNLLFSPKPDLPFEQIPPVILQITSFACGGFAMGASFNHNICDGHGAALFLSHVAEAIKGKQIKTKPSFNRGIFAARDPPRVMFDHVELQGCMNPQPTKMRLEWGEPEIFSVLVRSDAVKTVQERVQKCTSFEVLAALAWKARINALGIQSTNEVRMLFPVGMRKAFNVHGGDYGNGVFCVCAHGCAKDVAEESLSCTVKAVRNAKESVNAEYVRSAVDFIEKRNRGYIPDAGGFDDSLDDMHFSDWRWLGFHSLDFGCGETSAVSPGGWIKSPTSCLLLHAPKPFKGYRLFLCLPRSLVKPFTSHFISSLY